MSQSLVRSNSQSQPQLQSPELADLLREHIDAALTALAPGTRRAYSDGLNRFTAWFAGWLPHAPPQVAAALATNRPSDHSWWSAVTCLLRSGPLVASTVVATFGSSRAAGKAPATIALRLAATRWPFRLAYDAGIVAWQLRVRSPKVEPYKDTAGPGLDGVRRLFVIAQKSKKPLIAARDVALVHLLFTCALRREEASALRVQHYRDGRLWIKAKGKSERVPITLPDDVRHAIERYLALRSPVDLDAPLLASHTPDNTRTGDGRLTGSGIWQRLLVLARKAKLDLRACRPHGLRHAAITAALDATRDPRVVQRFSRHAKLDTVMRYDDNRADLGGAVAVQLAELVKPKR